MIHNGNSHLINSCRWLIKEIDGRGSHRCNREAETLCETCGEVLRAVVLVIAQTKHCHNRLDSAPRFGDWQAVEDCSERQLVIHSEHRDCPTVCRGIGNLGAPLDRLGLDLNSVRANGARFQRENPCDHLKQRGFSRPVWAGEHHWNTGFSRTAGIDDYRSAASGDSDVAEFDLAAGDLWHLDIVGGRTIDVNVTWTSLFQALSVQSGPTKCDNSEEHMAQNETSMRAAVMGLGGIGRAHLRALQATPGAEIAAVCDSQKSLLKTVGDEFEVEKRYVDFKNMLDREQLDTVSVATPNSAHAGPTIAALDHGVHVLVEKPMARTYSEAKQMVDAAERNDRVLQVVFNHRYRPDVQVLKQFIDDGGVGDIYHAKSRWLRRAGIPGRSGSWFINKEESGGGPLIDLGVHMLDMALYLLGEPEVEAVSGATYNKLGQRFSERRFGPDAVYEVEDFSTAFIRLAGGHTLELEASWATYRETGELINITLFGEDGGAELASKNYNPADTLRLFVDAGGVPAEIKPAIPSDRNRPSGHTLVLKRFFDAVTSSDWSAERGHEGLLRTWIIDAIYRSAAEGREIRLAELAAGE